LRGWFTRKYILFVAADFIGCILQFVLGCMGFEGTVCSFSLLFR
jgi:hypothetical protein